MNKEDKIQNYWNQYLASLPKTETNHPDFLDSFYFGISAKDADEILPLVLNGTKTATGSLKWTFDAENKEPPQKGDFNIVIDGNNNPRCIIETTDVKIIPFEQMDAEFAYACGEGDRSYEFIKKMYDFYLKSECKRLSKKYNYQVPIVCEWFKVVYSEDLTE